jgi:hypothetical protein
LGFGRIEGLFIHNGEPCYERAHRIVQEIKLGSEPERQDQQPNPSNVDPTLKKEFESLFGQLSQLHDCTVDIEIRHGAPFRLALERCYKDLVA